MATYYVDPADGGSNAGTEANPYTDLMSAIGAVADGDTILATGTQTLTSGGTATIPLSGLAGTYANGFITIKGVNSSWAEAADVFFCLDGNSANGATGLTFSDADGIILKNIEIKNCQSHGLDVTAAYADTNQLINLYSHDNTSHGFTNLTYCRYSFTYKCRAENNGTNGFESSSSGAQNFFNVSVDNGTNGWYSPRGLHYGSVFHNNSSTGAQYMTSTGAFFVHCVVDGNGQDGLTGYYNPNALVVFGCRVTNNGQYGIENTDATDIFLEMHNFINGNTSGDTPQGLWMGGEGTLTSGTVGYNDLANDDFNLTTSATLKGDTYIELPA
jgi:hypothetical protein